MMARDEDDYGYVMMRMMSADQSQRILRTIRQSSCYSHSWLSLSLDACIYTDDFGTRSSPVLHIMSLLILTLHISLKTS